MNNFTAIRRYAAEVGGIDDGVGQFGEHTNLAGRPEHAEAERHLARRRLLKTCIPCRDSLH